MSTLRRRIDDPAELRESERHQGRRRSATATRCISRARRSRSRAPDGRAGAGVAPRRALRLPPRLPAALAGLPPTPLETGGGARAAARARARHPDQGGRDALRLDRRRYAGRSRARARTDRGGADVARSVQDHKSTTGVHDDLQRHGDSRTGQPARPVKYILVTGGVVSSLGKGLAAASIGALLEGHGYKVALQKFDPYINVDPGHDEPVPARRGLRHRRRRRDGPRPRPLRALHQPDHDAQQQLDDRQDLPAR